MNIGEGALLRISQMICGDDPFNYFLYRSSSYLTNFFLELDMDYVHDGTTRKVWVNDVLKELNAKSSPSEHIPSIDICRVIEKLLDPENFSFNENLDHKKAIESVNKCLKKYNLLVIKQDNETVKIQPTNGEFVSTDYVEIPLENIVTFKPSVFQIPKKKQNGDLVSVMMPFNKDFEPTYKSILKVTDYMKLDCIRADNIWDNSTFIQDIFDIIYCSRVVIVDFTARNPNVMYETGIAHTLGKTVVPITQSLDDIPSDLGHHRALKYLPNEEGYKDLCKGLYDRLNTIFLEK